MYKTQGNSVYLKTQSYINLKTLLLWRLGRDNWGTYNALLSRNSFPNFLLGAFGDSITSFGSTPAPLVMWCIQLIAGDSLSPTLSWHWKHHPSPFPAKIISEPIFHTSRELRSKVGAAPYPPIMFQFCLHTPFPHYPSNLEFHHIDLLPYLFNSVHWVPTMGERCCCCAKSLQLCPTLCYLWTVARQAPLSTGILQPNILEWVSIPSSKGSSLPWDWTRVSSVSYIGRWVLYH